MLGMNDMNVSYTSGIGSQPIDQHESQRPLSFLLSSHPIQPQGQPLLSTKHKPVVTAPQSNSVQSCHESASINPLDLVQVKMETPSQEDIFSNKYDANPSSSRLLAKRSNTYSKYTIDKSLCSVDGCTNLLYKSRSSFSGYKEINEGPLNNTQECRIDKKKHKFHCTICSRKYRCLSEFKKHMRLHENIRLFQCPICDHKSLCKQSLNHHMIKHSNERPFLCQICAKSFKYKTALTKHLDVTHTEFKPFKCDVCNKCFAKEYLLKSHSTTHQTLKPFTCSICNMSYKSKRTLKEHIIRHVDKKPFKCPDCEECFSRPKLLKAHSISHLDAESLQELEELLEYNLS